MDRLLRRALVEDLNAAYAQCIDEDRLEAWPDFFAERCLYQVLPRENADRGLALGLIRCDSRGMLADRVVAHREANIYGPHAYRHVVGSVQVTGEREGLLEARANFAVYRTWLDAVAYGSSELYVVGEYRDRIEVVEGAGRFVERTVVIDTCRIDSLLATPL